MTWRYLTHFDINQSDLFGACSTTHMQGPVALQVGNVIRVYSAARDILGKSFPVYIDLAMGLDRMVGHSRGAVFERGDIGLFDDDGAMPACAMNVGSEVWLYYSGWNRRVTVPYHNTIGLARSEDGGASFKRAFDGPIMDRNRFDPLMCVTPFVQNVGDTWRMWYVSGRSWIEKNGNLEPTYDIRAAVSSDGLNWIRSDQRVIPLRHEEEAIARPVVLQRGGAYHMWYSFRDSADFRNGQGSYRIGYSVSKNGTEWSRKDEEGGFFGSGLDWDRHMQCYPYIIKVGTDLLMFYNGNGFGQTGIGAAIWDGKLPQP